MERRTVESPILLILRQTFLHAMLALFCLSSVCAQEVNGVWLSPDWYFPGNRRYTEQEVRDTAAQLFSNLRDRDVDAVFLETFLRGYAVCAPIQRGARGQEATVLDYQPGRAGFPTYPHLQWKYRVEFGTVLDPLQIFIEEGQAKGIEVHAWVQENQMERLSFVQDNTVRPGIEKKSREVLAPDIPVQVLKECAELFSRGCDTKQLERILNAAGRPSQGHPIGTLISWIIQSGGLRPDFLLMANDTDPFPAPRNTQLRSIYVDPDNPAVQKALLESIVNIAETHPGLAVIHLDHVRYPVVGQGLHPDT